jgi:hypothetical protein
MDPELYMDNLSSLHNNPVRKYCYYSRCAQKEAKAWRS